VFPDSAGPYAEDVFQPDVNVEVSSENWARRSILSMPTPCSPVMGAAHGDTQQQRYLGRLKEAALYLAGRLLIGYSIAIVLPNAEIVRKHNSVASQSPCQMIRRSRPPQQRLRHKRRSIRRSGLCEHFLVSFSLQPSCHFH
jgi:hypothetical protein